MWLIVCVVDVVCITVVCVFWFVVVTGGEVGVWLNYVGGFCFVGVV